MPLDLYYIPASSPCRAVTMLAKHLNIDLNLKFLDLSKGEHLKEDFLNINPQHCVPTLVDDGFILWESRAIMVYLISKYAPQSPLYPSDINKRAKVHQMLYYDCGTLFKTQVDYFFPHVFLGSPLDPAKEEIFKTKLNLLNKFLEGNKYVTGDDLSIADLSILASLTLMEVLDYDYSKWENLFSWYNRLKEELPYYKDINEKGLNDYREFIKHGHALHVIESNREKHVMLNH